jgi:hypothetical protein
VPSQQTYDAKPLPERLPYQAPQPRAHQPFDGTTTYLNEYKRHNIEPRAEVPHMAPMSACPATLPLTNSFTQCCAACAQPLCNPKLHERVPTTGVDAPCTVLYLRRGGCGHHTSQHMPADNTTRFDATSSYSKDYPGHIPPPRQAPAPMPARIMTKFEGASNYQTAYVQHPIEARWEP